MSSPAVVRRRPRSLSRSAGTRRRRGTDADAGGGGVSSPASSGRSPTAADAVTLAEVMTKTVVTTTADTPISRVLRMMYENNFRHVPVLDRLGTPIGIISIRDALGDELLSYHEEQDGLRVISLGGK